jgi:hypothetical protein
MVAIGGADVLGALLATAEAGLAHDPGNAVANAAVPLFMEFHQNAWTPIRLAEIPSSPRTFSWSFLFFLDGPCYKIKKLLQAK